MTINVVTMWYNETVLAPLFLRHYSYADRIVVILDSDTTDQSREIIGQFWNTEIVDFTFPDMMDDTLKAEKINEIAAKQTSEWIIAVDADEFIFAPGGESTVDFLVGMQGNLVYADMWQVYRHHTERDLDYGQSALDQRRHGDPNTNEGINAAYCKPIVVRSDVGLVWGVGCHGFMGNAAVRVCTGRMLGTHWSMADADLAIERRIAGRRERQSKHNLETGLTYQHHTITEAEIREECYQHLDDPKLF